MQSPVVAMAKPPVTPQFWPHKLRKEVQRMLELQCWCWGQDIKREEGNLLLAYGLQRQRPPDGKKGGNTYLLRLEGGDFVALWGFGIFYGSYDEGGIFAARINCSPRLWPAPEPPLPVWDPQQFALALTPANPAHWLSALILLARTMRWLALYERWVIANAGESFRQSAIERGVAAKIPALEMAPAWDRLAERCENRSK